MPYTLTFRHDIFGTVGSRVKHLAHEYPPPTLNVTEVFDRDFSVAADSAVTLWDPNNDAGVPASFTFLYLISDTDGFLELTCGEGETNEQVFAIPITADLPFMIAGADDSFRGVAAGSSAWDAGTADVIDKVRFKNTDTSNSANVRFVLAA